MKSSKKLPMSIPLLPPPSEHRARERRGMVGMILTLLPWSFELEAQEPFPLRWRSWRDEGLELWHPQFPVWWRKLAAVGQEEATGREKWREGTCLLGVLRCPTALPHDSFFLPRLPESALFYHITNGRKQQMLCVTFSGSLNFQSFFPLCIIDYQSILVSQLLRCPDEIMYVKAFGSL